MVTVNINFHKLHLKLKYLESYLYKVTSFGLSDLYYTLELMYGALGKIVNVSLPLFTHCKIEIRKILIPIFWSKCKNKIRYGDDGEIFLQTVKHSTIIRQIIGKTDIAMVLSQCSPHRNNRLVNQGTFFIN